MGLYPGDNFSPVSPDLPGLMVVYFNGLSENRLTSKYSLIKNQKDNLFNSNNSNHKFNRVSFSKIINHATTLSLYYRNRYEAFVPYIPLKFVSELILT